jgi:hypothetical protein
VAGERGPPRAHRVPPARLAVRNLPLAGPLSAAPIAGLVVLTVRDPFVLLLGLPVFLLHALKLIARIPARP